MIGVAAEEPGSLVFHFTPTESSKISGKEDVDCDDPSKLGPLQLGQFPKTKMGIKVEQNRKVFMGKSIKLLILNFITLSLGKPRFPIEKKRTSCNK
jgi:hypothetical protein